MADGKPGKPNIKRETLIDHGIVFCEAVYDPERKNGQGDDLPSHVEAVRKLLLDFSESVYTSDVDRLANEQTCFLSPLDKQQRKRIEHWSLLPPKSAHLESSLWTGGKSEKERRVRETLEQSNVAAAKAQALTEDHETGWTFYLRSHIFTDFRSSSSFETTHGSLFDRWCLEQDICWTDQTDHADTPIAGQTNRTVPKPDLTYAFPIFKSTDKLPPGFSDDDCTENFRVSFLAELRGQGSEGLRSSLTTGLLKVSRDERVTLRTPDRMCFPWAVVEVKRASLANDGPEPEKFCHCQAANATATAIRIQEALFQQATGSIPEDLPPIIAFTCVGPDFKLWLAYSACSQGLRTRKMTCIFATSLELTWGVCASRQIVAHMLIWASRVLRPKLSLCLSLIKKKRTAAQPRMMGASTSSVTENRNLPSGIFSPRVAPWVPSPSTDPVRTSLRPHIEARRHTSAGRSTAAAKEDHGNFASLDIALRPKLTPRSLKSRHRRAASASPSPFVNSSSLLFARTVIPAAASTTNDFVSNSSIHDSKGQSSVGHPTPPSSGSVRSQISGYRYHIYKFNEERIRLEAKDSSSPPGSDSEDGNYVWSSHSETDSEQSSLTTNDQREDQCEDTEGLDEDWNDNDERENIDEADPLRNTIDDGESTDDLYEEDHDEDVDSEDESRYISDECDGTDYTYQNTSDGYDDDSSSTEAQTKDQDFASTKRPRVKVSQASPNASIDGDDGDDGDDDGDDDADDDDAADGEDDCELSDKELAGQTRGEILSSEDMYELRKMALRSLDGLELISLERFEALVDDMVEDQLYGASDSLLLYLRLHGQTCHSKRKESLEAVCHDLNTAFELEGVGLRLDTQDLTAAQSSLARNALICLLDNHKPEELRRIFTNLLRALSAPWCAEALMEQEFDSHVEWVNMQEEALARIMRDTAEWKSLPPIEWEENPVAYGIWPHAADREEN